MNKKYVDTPSIVQVLGGLYKNPKLLDNEEYFFDISDFVEEFHKILFTSIYNLHALGAEEINLTTIEDYLEQRPKKLATFRAYKGGEYLNKLESNTQIAAFDYYYNRVKKMTLLRAYANYGLDLKWLYDPDCLDIKTKQQQEDWLDNTNLSDMMDEIEKGITNIRLKYSTGADYSLKDAGDGILELIDHLKEEPDIGIPLFGEMFNGVCMGARLGKFYLRSAATGVGKTRSMIADVCSIGCREIFDPAAQQWKVNNFSEPTLYITTEQELSEVQTMMLAFVSGVNEDCIKYNRYHNPQEIERVVKAGKIIKESGIKVKELPDFSLEDIENVIKQAVINYDIHYCFHDYIHTSIKILSEISTRAKVKNLREDNILFMISVKLKELCQKYNLFIMSSTQLSNDYKTASVYDQSLLRGAKSLADKVDWGGIMLQTTPEDLESVKDIINKGGFEKPAIKMSIYKNRGCKYKDILLWCKEDRGTCRIIPMFATDYSYKIVDIEKLNIEVA